jgi:eukaryotic-like serine/threonine-protein kinase
MSQSPTEKEIFRIASALETEELRSHYLGQVCGEDAALRVRIEALLRIAREETGLLPAPPVTGDPDVTPEWPPSEQPGEMIGPYRLCERIGEGGFGVVYAAEQSQPIRRRVAMKIIKPGMDSREVIARFNAERQTLALMDHPHIARVIDAGRAENGRPYFVMELFGGVPITQFCDDEMLNTRQRLRLFVDVCRAVQHAHQKGIIHRDLKPSNVLVMQREGRLLPKVIDFGVAKALSGRLTPDSVHTAQGQMIGTPLYMSPEQAASSGQDIDTRSDIYSLGVLLYELLIGTPPVDRKTLEGSGYDQVQRMLREFTPLKPSARLSTLHAEQRAKICVGRRIEDRQLLQLLRGELDWIVMKALEKDRDRRYESAAALADDIERYLAGDAVLAGPPSATYRLRKLAYRYRGLLASVTLVFLALSVGLVTALLQRREAINARAQVEETLEEVRLQKERAEVLAYAADIRSAAQALDRGDVLDAFETLSRQRPADGQTDQRGIEWSLLMNRARGTSSTSVISDKPLYTICEAPDSEHLVTGGADGMIYVLDAQTFATVSAFDSEQIEVNGLSFSADGKTLVSTGDDGNIRLWKFPSGEPLQTIPFGADKSYLALLTADREYLVACGRANDVRIFSLPSGQLTARLEFHERSVHDIALSPDGRLLACGSSDKRISVWDWREQTRLSRSDPRHGAVTSVAFSPDGRWIIDGGVSGHVAVTRVDDRRPVSMYRVGDAVQDVAVASDSASIAVLTRAGTLHQLLLDASAGLQEIVRDHPIRRIHSGRVYDAIWSDEQTLVSVGEDGHLSRTAMGALEEHSFEYPHSNAGRIAVSPDGRLLAWANWEQMGLRDLLSNNDILLENSPAIKYTRHLAFSPNGRTLVACGREGWLVAVPVERLQEAAIHRLAGVGDLVSPRFSRDGRRLAVVDRTRKGVVILAVPEFREISRFSLDLGDYAADLSSNGRFVVFNSARDLMIYNVDSGVCLARSDRHHRESIRRMSFLPGDDSIVTIGSEREIRLWNWKAGGESELVGVHPGGVPTDLVVSPDGRTAFSCGDRGEIALWCLPARQRLFTLGDGPSPYLSMQLAADGSVLAYVDDNGQVTMA